MAMARAVKGEYKSLPARPSAVTDMAYRPINDDLPLCHIRLAGNDCYPRLRVVPHLVELLCVLDRLLVGLGRAMTEEAHETFEQVRLGHAPALW